MALSYDGPHTVHVTYKKIVGLSLTVEGIEGSDIYIAYSGCAGVCLIVQGVIMMSKNHPVGNLIEPLGGNRIKLCLSKNAKVNAIFDHVALEDISFSEQHAIVQVSVKS